MGLGLWLGTGRSTEYLLVALVFGLLAVPVSAVFSCAVGWPRWVMAGIALVLFGLGVFGLGVGFIDLPRGSALMGLGIGSLNLFLMGALLSQWAANFLVSVRPKR